MKKLRLWDDHLNGICFEEIEDHFIMSENIFKGHLAVWFKTEDGEIICGFDVEMYRLLDDEDETSGRHVIQRFHILLSDVVFIDYREGCSVWVEQDAMDLGLRSTENLVDNESEWWKYVWALYPGTVLRHSFHEMGFTMDSSCKYTDEAGNYEVCLGKGVGRYETKDLIAPFRLEPDEENPRVDRDGFLPDTVQVKQYVGWQAIVVGHSEPLKIMLEKELVKRSNDRIAGWLANPNLDESLDAEMCFNGCLHMPLGDAMAAKIWHPDYEGNLMTRGDFDESTEEKKLKFPPNSNMFMKFPTKIFIAMGRLTETLDCNCPPCQRKVNRYGPAAKVAVAGAAVPAAGKSRKSIKTRAPARSKREGEKKRKQDKKKKDKKAKAAKSKSEGAKKKK